MAATRGLVIGAALLACGPQAGSGSETGAPASDTGSTTAPTTGAATIGDTTSGGTTTGSSDDATTFTLCPWDSSGGELFCPLLAAPNIAISGDSPFGPVRFEYAYFGLFRCGTCPSPEEPALAMFAQAQQPGLEPFVGDYLVFNGVHNGLQASTEGEIAGVPVDFRDGEEFPRFSGVVLVTEEQMMTPLDPSAPPTIGGGLTIDGEGWALAGEFTASLCTTLDRLASCG